MVASHLDQTVFLNGSYIQGREAKISIFDRGLLFSDAVYEGLGVLDARVIDITMHLGRLRASLEKLNITIDMSDSDLSNVFDSLIRANGVQEGFIYLHITRGESDRDYVYSTDMTPNIFAFTQSTAEPDADAAPKGKAMRSHPDLRWKRCDIKTSNLLGQVIAKKHADDHGAYEALMIDDQGFITEGGATSFFFVRNGVIHARPVSNDILHGITRQTMLRVAQEHAYQVEIGKFTLDQALNADEAFLTGASSYVIPVTEIDGQKIGTGQPGEFTLKLREKYLKAVRSA